MQGGHGGLQTVEAELGPVGSAQGQCQAAIAAVLVVEYASKDYAPTQEAAGAHRRAADSDLEEAPS